MVYDMLCYISLHMKDWEHRNIFMWLLTLGYGSMKHTHAEWIFRQTFWSYSTLLIPGEYEDHSYRDIIVTYCQQG